MKTISFEKELSFSRNNFKDINDFLFYLLENYGIEDEKVEFGVLKKDEITASLQEKIKQAKSGEIKFVNF